MEMQDYWPEDKVYLYGTLAFLPKSLENKALTSREMQHYFPHNTAIEFENALRNYEEMGLFKVQLLEKIDTPKMYMITDVKKIYFYNELVAYLNKIKLDDDRFELLLNVSARQRKQHGYEPVVRSRDIFGQDRYNYTPPFWELIFKLVIRGWLEIITADYTKMVPIMVKNEVVHKIPEPIRQLHERPIVKIAIKDKKVQRKVDKIRSAIKYKAKLNLTVGRRLRLSLDGNRYPIGYYKSKKSNTYRTIAELISQGRPLTISELGLKPNSKSKFKDLLDNAYISGILRDVFIKNGYDANHRPTIELKKSVTVNQDEYEKILEYVNNLNHLTE